MTHSVLGVVCDLLRAHITAKKGSVVRESASVRVQLTNSVVCRRASVRVQLTELTFVENHDALCIRSSV